MTDAAILAAIRDAPEDDLPRLAYADWLDENGRPERAEFIRGQIELSRGLRDVGRSVELSRRLRELTARHEAAWLGRLQELDREARFERGFVSQVSLTISNLVRHAAELLASHPITRVRLYGPTQLVGPMAASPHLAGMTMLDFQSEPLHDLDDVKALARSPVLGRLRVLRLARMALDETGVRALTASPQLAGLTELDLSQNHFGHGGVEAITNGLVLSRLARLDLSRNSLGSDSARALANCPKLEQLRVLRLSHNQLSHQDIEQLASSPFLRQVEVFDVIGNQLTTLQTHALSRRFPGRVLF